MKKILCILLSVCLLLSLAACGGDSETGSTEGKSAGTSTSDTLKVGYGKANITPYSSVALGGQGRSDQRISQNILSYLWVTCIAVTDADDNTLLLYGMDLLSPGEAYISFAADVSKATGVPVDNIVMSASHTHSAPDYGSTDLPGVADALQVLKSGLIKAGTAAMEDRKEATLSVATVETQGLNFVRHYLMNDGTYCGANFGSAASGYKEHATDADPTMQLVKFTREEGNDIILTNFQTHPHQVSATDSLALTADVVGEYRTVMEKEGVDVIYFSGAGGNINSTSHIKEENATSDFRAWGEKLAQYAKSAEYTPVASGKVKASKYTFEGTINHDLDKFGALCRDLRSRWDAGKLTTEELIAEGKENGIELNSAYHAGAIATRSTYAKTKSFEIWAYAFGDIGFVAAPYEMFDTNGVFIKENSPYEMTVIATLSNRANGYFPSDATFDYGSYETDTAPYVRGTAEQLADQYVSMLTELHNN